ERGVNPTNKCNQPPVFYCILRSVGLRQQGKRAPSSRGVNSLSKVSASTQFSILGQTTASPINFRPFISLFEPTKVTPFFAQTDV
ncbi:hypothetical protein BaRGS_00019588, partial [Batillaria attramentaria]